MMDDTLRMLGALDVTITSLVPSIYHLMVLMTLFLAPYALALLHCLFSRNCGFGKLCSPMNFLMNLPNQRATSESPADKVTHSPILVHN